MSVLFEKIEVNERFSWRGLTFVKSSDNHGECIDDESQSMFFHFNAPVTPVASEESPVVSPDPVTPAESASNEEASQEGGGEESQEVSQEGVPEVQVPESGLKKKKK